MTPNAFADVGAEKSCIGALIQDSTCLYMLDELRPEDFTCPEYADVFRSAARLRAQRQPVDMQTLLTDLQQRQSQVSTAVLSECYRYVPSTANSQAYVDIVRERSRRREVKALCEQTLAALPSDGADVAVDAALDALRGMIGGKGGRETSAQVAAATYGMLEDIRSGKLRTIPLRYPDVNAIMGNGLRKSEMTILAAHTGQGKSALAQEIARDASAKGFRVLLYSGEMSAEQYGLRAFSSASGVGIGEMLNAQKMTADQWDALAAAAEQMSRQNVEFAFLANTVEDIRREVRRMKGLDLLVVDYVQLLDTEVRYQNDNARVGRISRVLKNLSREMGIHVLALSQFSRPPKASGPMPRPRLSDLRDSGCLEQDADNVWLMWQPKDGNDPEIPPHYAGWYESAQDQGDRFLLFDVAKQRMGPVGLTALQFSPRHMTFYTPKIDGR